MALLGKAALAMWWDIAPEVRSDFENWHSHEHFPERMGIPGFRRGSRWGSATGGEGFFVLYELEAYETLSSPHYLASLNSPTPWSTSMMPHHRNMVRSQCHVMKTHGGGVSRHALTLRFSPVLGRDDELQGHCGALIDVLVSRPGLTGAHLLRHETPAIAATTEQKLRKGADQAADWIFVVCGYDAAALTSLQELEFGAAALESHGAAPGLVSGLYLLSYTATSADVS